MDNTPPNTPTVVSVTIGPRVLAFVVLFLRIGLGLGTLNMGLLGFQMQMTGGSGRSNPYAQLYAQGIGLLPGFDPIYQVLPYAQIAVGLALVLGFMTTAAAVVAGVLLLTQPLTQSLSLLMGGMSSNTNMMMRGLPMPMMLSTGSTPDLFLAAVVAWLSPVRTNRLSLDAVMLRRRARRGAAEPANAVVAKARPNASWVGRAGIGLPRDDETLGFATGLAHEFDPDALPEDSVGPNPS